jgi:spore coat polysaccharide biosynthesis protein SpsF
VKTVIILQARMSSSRLPGKIMLKLKGKTVLEHIIGRLSTFKQADDLIVATTDTPKDDITREISEKMGVKVFRGSEENVLERYFMCAKEAGAEQIIRATADDPLTSIELLNIMFDSHLKTNADYTYSDGFPIGIQEEIVKFEALQKCYELSYKPNHFEHVLEYILENENYFSINKIQAEGEMKRPDIRVTLDTEEDYHIINKYYNHFEDLLSVSMHDIISYWDQLQ